MKSAVTPSASSFRSARVTSAFESLKPASRLSDFRLCRIRLVAEVDDSTKYTLAAPRLSASIPTAPVPAHRSSQILPSNAVGFPEASTLNRVSRKRSDVGRRSSPRSDRNGRCRYFPAITLKSRFALCGLASLSTLDSFKAQLTAPTCRLIYRIETSGTERRFS